MASIKIVASKVVAKVTAQDLATALLAWNASRPFSSVVHFPTDGVGGAEVAIMGIEHEDGSGHSFNILATTYTHGQRVSIYYNAETGTGTITEIEQRAVTA